MTAPRDVAHQPLIGTDKSACLECWGCVRHCPARAIRVIERTAEVIAEKCVACGLCVGECGRGGHYVRDDTPRVRELLESGRPVVAILASEFVAAMHPRSPAQVERELETAGFYAVESTVLGEEMVALAYGRLCRRPGSFPVLRSTCPVTVEWVRRYHPKLVQALAPVVPPYVAQARLVKALYPSDTAVVYVSPCYARKDEVADPQFAGAVDAAIDFGELERLLGTDATSPGPAAAGESGARRPAPVKELSLTDGFPRGLMASRTGVDTDVLVIRGLRAVDGALYGLEHGESGPVIVDMMMCEGCLDGPTVNPGMSVFAKRNIEQAAREARSRSTVSSEILLRHLPAVDVVRSFDARPVHVPNPTDEELDAILAEGGFASRSQTVDCGLCGYDTCVEHAVAVHEANSTWEMCFPLQRRLLEQKVEILGSDPVLDPVTGLWSRRIFAERLVDEMARFDRYETPVTLLMVDVDRFARIRDTVGAEGADRVLAALARHLRDTLRTSDLPSRYATDKFAVILPGMRKTAAFAVAEKLRESIAALRPNAGADGDRLPVDVTVSVGVASASAAVTDAPTLIEAADGALYQAKENGRDQVRLA